MTTSCYIDDDYIYVCVYIYTHFMKHKWMDLGLLELGLMCLSTLRAE